MSIAGVDFEGLDVRRQAVDIPAGRQASKAVTASFGFWLFLLSDVVAFGALFAAYAVLNNATAGGPTGTQLFDLRHVGFETAALLTSSLTCGLCALSGDTGRHGKFYLYAVLTLALGALFLGLEISEFSEMVARGDGPSRSAFLSAFFTLVGTHGLHVTSGLLWLVVMMAQVATLGFRPMVLRRLRAFAFFWHALDIVWIGVFTIVYLGAFS
jgi:cytochrome o ubiquinol oxidase subunit 3